MILCCALVACAATVVSLPEPIDTTNLDSSQFRLVDAVDIKAARTASLTLRSDTRWSHIGTISYGRVFDTDDQVVIVNSFDVHEAAIVVENSSVVGYYLKVARAFVASRPTPINFIKLE